jgi:1,4-dihydroxy-2-naphthoate octaprenyltransferase
VPKGLTPDLSTDKEGETGSDLTHSRIWYPSMSRLWSLFLLARAHFLAGGLVMYGMGVAAALAGEGSQAAVRLLWGQLGVSAIQLMTHFVNEYFDAPRDALVETRTPFSGGSGVLPAGRVGRDVALRLAAPCGLVGVAVTVTVGWPVAVIYAAAQLIGVGYSAPPVRLMTRGVGEVAAALTVALLTPLAGYGVTAGRLSAQVLWLALPLFPLSLAFMILVELPDYESDRPTGKRNWVVRWGRDRAGILHNGLLLLAYLCLGLVTGMGRLPQPVPALLWWTTPLAVWQFGLSGLQLRRGWRRYGLLAGGGMALIGLYGLLAIVGYRSSVMR